VQKEEQVFAKKAHVIPTSMAQHKNDYAFILQRIATLTTQYEEALKKGVEFSVLKKIREELKQLKKDLSQRRGES
jgi:hypothetical protein